MRCTLPMRCSNRAGFQGGSKLMTADADWRLRPTPPASVDRKTMQLGSSRKRSISAPRLGEGTPPCRETKSIPSLASSSPARRVIRSYSLKTTTFRPSSTASSRMISLNSSSLGEWFVSLSNRNVELQSIRMFWIAQVMRRRSTSDSQPCLFHLLISLPRISYCSA